MVSLECSYLSYNIEMPFVDFSSSPYRISVGWTIRSLINMGTLRTNVLSCSTSCRFTIGIITLSLPIFALVAFIVIGLGRKSISTISSYRFHATQDPQRIIRLRPREWLVNERAAAGYDCAYRGNWYPEYDTQIVLVACVFGGDRSKGGQFFPGSTHCVAKWASMVDPTQWKGGPDWFASNKQI